MHHSNTGMADVHVSVWCYKERHGDLLISSSTLFLQILGCFLIHRADEDTLLMLPSLHMPISVTALSISHVTVVTHSPFHVDGTSKFRKPYSYYLRQIVNFIISSTEFKVRGIKLLLNFLPHSVT